MSSERQHSSANTIMLIVPFVLIFLFEYLIHNEFVVSKNDGAIFSQVIEKFQAFSDKSSTIIRIFYIILIFSFIVLTPSPKVNKNLSDDDKLIYRSLCLITTILILVGFVNFDLYDVFIYPLAFLSHIFVSTKALTNIRQNFDDENVFGVNQSAKGKCVFKFKLDPKEPAEYLIMPNSNYGVIFDGGTGSGKSASGVKPMIAQAAEDGFTGVIYDYNGNPLEETNPILTRVALYGIKKGIEKAQKEGKEFNTKLAFLNFNDLTKSVRVNPVDVNYIKSKIDIINISTALMKNLERTWKEKIDFWGQNAIQILTAGIHYLHKNHPDKCDIPHVIAMLLSPYEKFLKLIASDEEVCRDFMPVYSAYIAKAEGQIAGAIASAQAPLSKLDTPEIFWILSKNELSLDITNKEHPTLLCIGNDPNLSEALAGVISVIVLTCMSNMNKPGRLKSIFCFDEIPTIILYKLDEFIAVCRKYLVCCIFGVQTHEQFGRDYGEKSANTIRNTLGNFFFGSTGDIKTAEYFSNQIGTIKKLDTSYTEGDNSNSASERMNNEKAVQPRDVMSQDIGHFMGKVIGGKPAYFSCQFDYFRPEEEDPNYIAYTDIKPFANYYQSADPEAAKKSFNEDVKNNYAKIYAEINQMLDDANTDDNLEKLFQNIYKNTKHLNTSEKELLIQNMKEAMDV